MTMEGNATKAVDRRTELDLLEVVGREAPPDLGAAILERLATADTQPGAATERRWVPQWLAAAVLMGLGLAAVGAAAVWGLGEGRATTAAPPTSPPAPQDPEVVRVDDPEALANLPISTRRIAVHWISDAEMPLLARFAELRALDIGSGRPPSGNPRESPVTLTDEGLARLAESTKLERLRVANAEIDGTGLAPLVRLPALRQLELWRVEPSADGLRAIGELPNLRDLSLTLCGLDAADLDVLADARHLRLTSLCLEVGPRHRAQAGAGVIRLMARPESAGLTHLELDAGTPTEALFATLDDLPLTSLEIIGPSSAMDAARRFHDRRPGCEVRFRDDRLRRQMMEAQPTRWIDTERWAHVQPGRNLSVIPTETEDLRVAFLPAEDAPLLSRFAKLRQLAIVTGRGDDGDERALTPLDDGFCERITDPTGIEELALTGCPKVTGAGLARFENLKKLRLSDCGLTAAGMRAIAALPALESLEIRGTIEDGFLRILTASDALRLRALQLHPRGDARTDPGEATWQAFFARPGFDALEEIVLEGVPLTDRMLDAIGTPSLERFDAPEVPEETLDWAAFERQNPGCNVLRRRRK